MGGFLSFNVTISIDIIFHIHSFYFTFFPLAWCKIIWYNNETVQSRNSWSRSSTSSRSTLFFLPKKTRHLVTRQVALPSIDLCSRQRYSSLRDRVRIVIFDKDAGRISWDSRYLPLSWQITLTLIPPPGVYVTVYSSIRLPPFWLSFYFKASVMITENIVTFVDPFLFS